jgi:glycosyltransferase involved in cell wall biosynthesis
MSTYNAEFYLREQLDGIAVQTRLPDELVVSDDGSRDGTLAVVNDFAAAPFPVESGHDIDAILQLGLKFGRSMKIGAGSTTFCVRLNHYCRIADLDSTR